MNDQLALAVSLHLFVIVIYCLVFFRALETYVCSRAKLVHESACIAQPAAYCTVILLYGTFAEVDRDILEQSSSIRYSTRLHVPFFWCRTILNWTIPEYCASVNRV